MIGNSVSPIIAKALMSIIGSRLALPARMGQAAE